MKLTLALLFYVVCKATAHALNPRAEQLDGSGTVIFPRLNVTPETIVVNDDSRTPGEADAPPAADSIEDSGLLEASYKNEDHVPLEVLLTATTEASFEEVGPHPI